MLQRRDRVAEETSEGGVEEIATMSESSDKS